MTHFRLCWHFNVAAHTPFLHFSFVPLLCERWDLPPGWDFLKCHPSKPQLLPYLKTPSPSLPRPVVPPFSSPVLFLPLIFACSWYIQGSSMCFFRMHYNYCLQFFCAAGSDLGASFEWNEFDPFLFFWFGLNSFVKHTHTQTGHPYVRSMSLL